MSRTAALALGLISLTMIAGCDGGSSPTPAPTPTPTPTPIPTPTPTPTPAATPIQIESGNQQTVDQGNVLANPLQVRLFAADGKNAPDVPVVFTGFRNAGLNLPDTVQTNALGIATWLPGYFNVPGVYAITASAKGYGTVKFTVHVTKTPYQYDGFYHCRTASTVVTDFFKLTVKNNQVVDMQTNIQRTVKSASITPDTDILLFTIETSSYRMDGGAHITIDSSGTSRPFGYFVVNRKSDGARWDYGSWACLRD